MGRHVISENKIPSDMDIDKLISILNSAKKNGASVVCIDRNYFSETMYETMYETVMQLIRISTDEEDKQEEIKKLEDRIKKLKGEN